MKVNIYRVNEARNMRINVYNSDFHALQSSCIQVSLPKNKRQKYQLLQILQILILNISTLIHTIF